MQKLGMSKEECIAELQSYLDEIKTIRKLFKAEGILSRDDKARIKDLVKKLKDRFRADIKPRDTVRGKEQMSRVERDIFFHFIHGAFYNHVNLIKLNSAPDKSWVGNLYDATIDINFALDQLQKNTN
jgi:hypothetical protein